MRKNHEAGQATSELVIMPPLFLLLAGGTLCVGYMCWQGLKVQQAANLAARIQGQERVAGATSPNSASGVDSINNDNGLNGFGDRDPSDAAVSRLQGDSNSLSGYKGQAPGGVYGNFYKAVNAMFSSGERAKLFVPPPVVGMNSDEVRVIRVLNPPKFGSFQLPAIKLKATAYGGEDTRMFGLPRWGRGGGAEAFYKEQLKKSVDD